MKLTVKQNYIMVEPISMKQKQVGLLYVPSDHEDTRMQRGTAVAVGDGVMPDGTVRAMGVKTGETVLYPVNTGHSTKMENKEYFLIREDDIIGVLEE